MYNKYETKKQSIAQCVALKAHFQSNRNHQLINHIQQN